MKLRDVAIGASPIIVLIFLVHFAIAPMSRDLLITLIISIFMMIFGQAFFLVGVDSSFLTMGELVGNNIRKLKKLWIILAFGFLFGTMATYAEPAVGVLSGLVNNASGLNAQLITWVVSCGIGIFVAYALIRVFKQFSIKISLMIAYAVTFVLVFCAPPEFRAVAFDFGGAATGVITVPFILALGVGVTAVLGRKDQSDSYGLIGLATIGPVITMCILGIISGPSTGVIDPDQIVETLTFGQSLLSSFTGILIALTPITVIFLVFNFAFVRLPKKMILRTAVGILVTVFGLTVFLTAIKFGFQSAGMYIGEAFTRHSANWVKYLLIPFGFVLGFAITYSEPAIRVLATQVEQNTNKLIRKRTLLLTLAFALGSTIMFGMLRILFNIDILYFLVPIFVIGLVLAPFINRMFVGLAFDSGGVASGTITASFMVPLAIGACKNLDNIHSDQYVIYGFGMIAFIAAIPVVAISLLGLIYQLKVKQEKKFSQPLNPDHLANVLVNIITSSKNEHAITELLAKHEIILLSTFNAAGARAHLTTLDDILDIVDQPKIMLMGLGKQKDAQEVIGILETEFEFAKAGADTGIAFTIKGDY